MKNSILSLIVLGMPLLVNSQVSLNASLAPAINSMFIYYDANIPSPPFTFSKTGTNNTWDFSVVNAVPGADDTTFVVAPSSVPLAATFPAATHCTYEAATNPFYTFLQVNTAGLNLLGAVTDVANNGNIFPLKLNAPIQSMAFPYTYGSSGSGSGFSNIYTTGTAVGQPSVDSVHFKGTLFIQHDVIAAGNIILPAPAGTMPAILERTITTRIDSAWGKGLVTFFQWLMAPGYPQTTVDSAFYWYTNNSLLPYAHALYDNTGLYDVNFFKSPNVVDVNESPLTSLGNIYPDPVTDILHLNFKDNLQKDAEYRIFNASGQLLWSGNSTITSVNVSHLSKGVYFLHFSDNSGGINVKKYIKE